MNVKYTIWHDADYDLAYWVYRNSVLKNKKTLIKNLPKNTSHSTLKKMIKEDLDVILLPIIKYEHPDIIITVEYENCKSRVLCVVEFMTHTPQWQHPAQRFARIYGATNMRVPCALVVPGKKAKLEKNTGDEYKDVIYKLSDSVKYLFEITEKITKTPARIFQWPDKDGYLKLDRKSPTSPMIEGDVKSWFEFIDTCVNGELEYSDSITMKKPVIEDFSTLCGFEHSDVFCSENNIDPSTVSLHKKSLIFAPTGLSPPSSYFRTDPYAGMLCAFDNIFCRNENGTRDHSLILIAKCVEYERLINRGTFSEDVETHLDARCPFLSFCNSKEDMLAVLLTYRELRIRHENFYLESIGRWDFS